MQKIVLIEDNGLKDINNELLKNGWIVKMISSVTRSERSSGFTGIYAYVVLEKKE